MNVKVRISLLKKNLKLLVGSFRKKNEGQESESYQEIHILYTYPIEYSNGYSKVSKNMTIVEEGIKYDL